MTTKDFLDKLLSRFLLLNLLAMAVVTVLLMAGVKVGLDLYTHHGEGIVVPDVVGMGYEKAYRQLDELGLGIVVSDSGYNKKVPANAILAQTPGGGQKVKKGHTIYITVNSPSSPTFAIPDIVDNSSVREAEAKLMAIGFRLTEPQMVTGEKDWVYGILCRGRRVSNGDRIAIDHPLTLMVGSGTYDETEELNYVDPVYSPDMGAVDDFEEVTETAAEPEIQP